MRLLFLGVGDHVGVVGAIGGEFAAVEAVGVVDAGGAEWASLGVRTVDGKKPSGAGRYSIVIPRGSEGAYLTTANYDVIMKWNRSTFFATAVGTLADRLK